MESDEVFSLSSVIICALKVKFEESGIPSFRSGVVSDETGEHDVMFPTIEWIHAVSNIMQQKAEGLTDDDVIYAISKISMDKYPQHPEKNVLRFSDLTGHSIDKISRTYCSVSVYTDAGILIAEVGKGGTLDVDVFPRRFCTKWVGFGICGRELPCPLHGEAYSNVEP